MIIDSSTFLEVNQKYPIIKQQSSFTVSPEFDFNGGYVLNFKKRAVRVLRLKLRSGMSKVISAFLISKVQDQQLFQRINLQYSNSFLYGTSNSVDHSFGSQKSDLNLQTLNAKTSSSSIGLTNSSLSGSCSTDVHSFSSDQDTALTLFNKLEYSMTQSVPLQRIDEDNANTSESAPHRSDTVQFINFINDLLNKTFQEERG